VCLAVVCAVCALLAAGAAASESYEQEYNRGLQLGVRGYIYGEPLLDTERIFKTSTSVTVATEEGYAPVNQLSHFPHLVTTKESIVVAPNDDTLYAIGWLDLRHGPVVMRVPSANRFDVIELVSPWTENFANIGTEASGIYEPGNYLIVPPGADEGLQEAFGLKVIHSPYDRVWAIGRVVVEGPGDTPNALAIEEQMKVVPLEDWLKQGFNYQPPTPRRVVTEPTEAHVPGTLLHESPLRYWKALAHALKQFPPPAADKPILEELAAVHIGPGKIPTRANDGKAVLEGLSNSVSYAAEEVLLDIKESYERGFAAHDGWLVSGSAGHYGTNYVIRAEVDRLGVGALSPNVSIYPLALTDDTEAKLTGFNKRYVVRFPASDFPIPVKAFWSMTMYEASGFLVANPLERYALGNRSTLHFNPDGSLDVYVQSAEPTNEEQLENWLPAPAGEFHMVMRLYATEPQDIGPITSGAPGSWQPPKIEPCLETGFTAGGQECAD